MGSVKLETRNDGRGQREWDYVTQTERRIVSALIRNRGKLDPAYYPSLFAPSLSSTAGVFQFSEPIICVYIDQERLIETCGLSKSERFTVDKVMFGYSFSDLESLYGKSRQTFEKLFDRAVAKICQKNDQHWRDIQNKHICLRNG